MERLWTPWRSAYVSGTEKKVSPGATGCIFCDKPSENKDEENGIVARGETCYVILNAYPYNNGHLMVVPLRHVSRLDELSPAELAELMQAAAFLTTTLRIAYNPAGYNIGMNVGSAAGAGIAAHLHLHIVPRWNGDTNFMPVVGGVKVMPETLDQTYQKITTALSHQADEIPTEIGNKG